MTKKQESNYKHIQDCTYEKDEIINPDCPACQDIWCNFIEKNNLYVVTDSK